MHPTSFPHAAPPLMHPVRLSRSLRFTVAASLVAQVLPPFHEIMHQLVNERTSCAVADLFARSTGTVLERNISAFCDTCAMSLSGKARGGCGGDAKPESKS